LFKKRVANCRLGHLLQLQHFALAFAARGADNTGGEDGKGLSVA
jgi:hypothetical protein